MASSKVGCCSCFFRTERSAGKAASGLMHEEELGWGRDLLLLTVQAEGVEGFGEEGEGEAVALRCQTGQLYMCAGSRCRWSRKGGRRRAHVSHGVTGRARLFLNNGPEAGGGDGMSLTAHGVCLAADSERAQATI